jgi:phage gp45-like
VSVPVIDSTGFSTGDWVVFDKDGQRTRTAIAVAAGKLSNVPDGTHIEIDKLTVNVASGVYVTKLTATTDNVLAATATSGLTAAGKRSNLASPDGNGYEVFVMDLSTAATATTLVGRVILSGSLMDINPTGRFDYT